MTDSPTVKPISLRPREAAHAIGVSERTLWSWTRQGIVPCVRVGRVVLYSSKALQEWLDQQSQGVNQ